VSRENLELVRRLHAELASEGATQGFAKRLTDDALLGGGGRDFEDPDSETVRIRERLERATGAENSFGLIALVEPGVPIDSPEGRARVEGVAGGWERGVPAPLAPIG
jgi:hypothetical protein